MISPRIALWDALSAAFVASALLCNRVQEPSASEWVECTKWTLRLLLGFDVRQEPRALPELDSELPQFVSEQLAAAHKLVSDLAEPEPLRMIECAQQAAARAQQLASIGGAR